MTQFSPQQIESRNIGYKSHVFHNLNQHGPLFLVLSPLKCCYCPGKAKEGRATEPTPMFPREVDTLGP